MALFQWLLTCLGRMYLSLVTVVEGIPSLGEALIDLSYICAAISGWLDLLCFADSDQ